jgi:hypothetical protein
MRNRILKRPMFRLGGSAENEGIMDGMRKRYEQGTKPEDIDSTYTAAGADFQPTNQGERSGRRFRDFLVQSPGLSGFLTEFGLNLLSQSPTGNIFQTAATAAKGPFQRLKARGAMAEERDFERELLERKIESQEKIAESRGGDKMYDMMYKLGLEKFENPALARNYANYFDTIEPTVQTQYGSQWGGVIEQDVSVQKDARTLGKNLEKRGKLNKIFYDVYTGTFKQLVKDQRGNYNFIPVPGSANVTDPEGETLPTETEQRNEYRDKINPELEKIRKQKQKEFRESLPDFTPDEDVDI